MTDGRIGIETLNQQLPAILREQFRRDGLPPGHLPSWEYITANTRYSAEGLNINCKQLFDQTLHEFLQEQGFGYGDTGKWPTEDEETIRSLDYYISSLENHRDFDDQTTDTVKSVINKVYEAIRKQYIDVEILELGYYSTDHQRIENIQRTITVIQYLDEHLADSTMLNYTHYFSVYYDIVKNNFRINLNPVEEALDEFDWSRNRGNPQPVKVRQLQRLWRTLESLRECPVRGYPLDQWRLWMKMLIVFLIAVGPRSNEVESVDIRNQLYFGDDPHIHYENRKNLEPTDPPEKVPIMIGTGYLEAYRDYIVATNGNGNLVPSPQSESGSRTASTLNSWLARLCKRANVTLDDGSYPTMQNFRQFWATRYKEAVHENREQIKFISEEAGTNNPEVLENNYLGKEKNRRQIRELGRRYFAEVLTLDELPLLVKQELEKTDYIERQTNLSDF